MVPSLHKERKPMMRKFLVSLGAAATLWLTSGTAAHAQIINFIYSPDPNVNPSPPSSGPHAGDATQIYNNNNSFQTSSIQFTPGTGAAPSYNVGTGVPSQFIMYNMTTNSSVLAGTSTPYDSFSAVPFDLKVKVTDQPSGGQNTFEFKGTYTADTVSSTSSHVDPVTQGIAWSTPLTQSLALGTNPGNTSTYTMKIISWTAPGAPGSSGSILAEVTVVPGDGGSGTPPPPPPNGSPEPTSLVLAGLALPALLVARRRLRKPVAA
jgi:hypothetical protein